MKLLIDFLPIVIFFIVYKMAPQCIETISPLLNAEQIQQLTDMPAIVLATAVLIPATMLQILYTRLTTGKIETMHLVTLGLVVVMGGEQPLFYKTKRLSNGSPPWLTGCLQQPF